MSPFSLEDIGSLALLAKVAEQRSFSAAARELGLAKSAVSKRIAVLEDKLGVRLLVRTTRHVSLSEAGLRLHEHCEHILNATRGAAVALQETEGGVRGRIRINAPALFAERVLARLLFRFLEAHPAVDVELSVDDAPVDLTTGRHDVVIRIARVLPDRSIVARVLAKDQLVLVAAPAYLEKYGEPVFPQDLLHHRCMRYTQRSAAVEWRFKGVHGPRVVMVPVRFAAGDDLTLRTAALQGLGLTIMPESFVAQEIKANELKVVLNGLLWQPERTVFGLLPDGRMTAPRVRSLVDFITKNQGSNFIEG